MNRYLITVELIDKRNDNVAWYYSDVVVCDKIRTWTNINDIVRKAFNKEFGQLDYDDALKQDKLKVILLQEL